MIPNYIINWIIAIVGMILNVLIIIEIIKNEKELKLVEGEKQDD